MIQDVTGLIERVRQDTGGLILRCHGIYGRSPERIGSAHHRQLPVHSKALTLSVIASHDPGAAPRATRNLGVLLEKQGDVEGARAVYQRVVDSGHPDQPSKAMANLRVLESTRPS